MSIITITSQNFESEVLGSDKPILLDFWATWCGPCRMISPVVDEIAAEHTDIKVGKVNVDENPDLLERFNIRSIPTLMAFEDGNVKSTSVGVVSKEKILEMFDA